ncbi:MAG: flippase-like domain-containing protein [Candidatus Zixiibacteriota bacterium]|nr:MAG: flippase-like domain-containing protein [candidate division Zixibacteria bacterium]
MKVGLPEQTLPPKVHGHESRHSREHEVPRARRQGGRLAFLKKIAAVSIILACFFFLGRVLYRNLGELSSYQWSLKPWLLALSFVFLFANLTVSSFAWKRVLLLFGARLPFQQCFKIMFVSALGKYLPGKVWPYVGQMYLSGRAGIPRSVTLLSVLLLFGISSLVGLLAFISSLFFWGGFSVIEVSLLLSAFTAFILIILSPPVLNRLLRALALISNRFRKGLIPEGVVVRGGLRDVGRIILIFVANWVIFGIALHLVANSLYHLDVSQTIILCGIFAVSVISGILSFFVPAGLGVREGVLSYLLGLFIPISVAIVIALALRVWMILGELLCFFTALRIKEPKLW